MQQTSRLGSSSTLYGSIDNISSGEKIVLTSMAGKTHAVFQHSALAKKEHQAELERKAKFNLIGGGIITVAGMAIAIGGYVFNNQLLIAQGALLAMSLGVTRITYAIGIYDAL